MSLIQAALDRAEEPKSESNQNPQPPAVTVKPEPVKSEPVKIPIKTPAPQPIASKDLVASAPTQVHDEPRLKAIRYYETENKIVEEAIQKKNIEKIRKETIANLENETEHASRKNILGLILALLFLSFAASRFLIPSSKSGAPAGEIKVPAAVPASEKPQAVIVKTEAPVTGKSIAQVKFLLTGITAAGDVPLAVINNQVVGIGDKLREGAFVRTITEQRVVLDLDGKQIVLNF